MEPNSLLALRWLRSTYTQVWAVDTEYRQTPEGSPHVVCVVMREVFGRLPALHLFEHEFQKECPVDFSRSDVLFVSYAAPAEIGSFLQIGWPVPRNILDLFVEARMNANTIGDIKSIQRVKLLSTLAHYGLDSMDYVEKDEMRALILGKASYTPEERKRILEYCDKDVLAIIELLPFMLPEIPGLVDAIKTGDRKTGWVQALFRGRYQAAVTRIDREGVPIDVEMHDRLMTVRPQIRQRLIDETNLKYDVYTGDTFTLAKFTAFLNRQGIWWPQTRTGLPKTDEATFDSMRYTWLQMKSKSFSMPAARKDFPATGSVTIACCC
jgi:DNA polymerase I